MLKELKVFHCFNLGLYGYYCTMVYYFDFKNELLKVSLFLQP